jgi:hypothetical protein
VRRLIHRLTSLETRAQSRQADAHFIHMLKYPCHLACDALEAWIAEQLACGCYPDCPGKRVGLLLPEKCKTAEDWAEWARRRSQRSERVS